MNSKIERLMLFNNFHKVFWIQALLVVYLISILSTMAGMEISAWLLAALVFWTEWRNHRRLDHDFDWRSFRLGPDLFLAGLVIVTFLGLVLNGDNGVPLVHSLGKMRWVILLYALVCSFKYLSNQTVYIANLIVWSLAALISIYAIAQHYTGVDWIRESHRAVQFFGYRSGRAIFRAAGLFSSPMTYGYSFGLLFFLSLFLSIEYFKTQKVRALGLALTSLLIGASLLATMQRGVWLAMFIATCVTVSIKNLRALVPVAIIIVLVVLQLDIGDRIKSVLDPNYASNQERVILWKANWEIFKDYPVLGIGYLDNERRIGEYLERIGQPKSFQGHAHNNFLQILAGTGLLGLICYLVIMIWFMILALQVYLGASVEAFWAKGFGLGSFGAQLFLHLGGLSECNFKDQEVNHLFIFILAVTAFLYVRTHPKMTSNKVRVS